MASFKTLPGFREFYPEDCAKKNFIFQKWRNTALSFGFSEFEPPILEQLELFTEKSGEEIKSQLFEFTDKGGRQVALRPEMTPSLARMVGARAGGIRRPVKWFAIGENYRYERQQKGRLRAFFQYNADILGEESVNADAEVMALLIESLKSFGLTASEFKLRLGDRLMWVLFLQNLGIAEEYLVGVLSAIDKIQKVSPEAFFEMLGKALAGANLDTENIVSRIKTFISAASVDEIGKAFGDIADAQIAQKLESRTADWNALFGLLNALNVGEFVQPDMGIVRGLAYYTGFVFEAFQIVGTGRALAGGGRYDALVKKLGYQDMCAVGFGMGDVTVGDLLELVGKGGTLDNGVQVFVVSQQGDSFLKLKAISIASKLRESGIRTEYSFKDASFGKQFKQADSLGAKIALIAGGDELNANCVKIKNLKSGEEKTVALDSVVSEINSAL